MLIIKTSHQNSGRSGYVIVVGYIIVGVSILPRSYVIVEKKSLAEERCVAFELLYQRHYHATIFHPRGFRFINLIINYKLNYAAEV